MRERRREREYTCMHPCVEEVSQARESKGGKERGSNSESEGKRERERERVREMDREK